MTTVVAAVCLQYVVVVSASFLLRRQRRRHRQYWVKPWIRKRNVSGAYHSLFQQLLTTDAQAFQNFTRMDFVAFDELLSRVEARIIKRDTQLRPSILLSYSVPFKVGGVAKLSSCHVIGCSHRNTGRYTGVNEHCAFPPI